MAFGLLGHVLAKLNREIAPMLLGFILGPMVEENLRRSLTLSRGDPSIFLKHPISAGLLAAAVLALGLVLLPSFRKTRAEAFAEDRCAVPAARGPLSPAAGGLAARR